MYKFAEVIPEHVQKEFDELEKQGFIHGAKVCHEGVPPTDIQIIDKLIYDEANNEIRVLTQNGKHGGIDYVYLVKQ